MSHELRTPLNAILGFAQLMESGAPPPTPSQKRNLDQILKAGWYLLELINEILDLALIESGKVMLSREPVSLVEVMLECRAMIEPQAQQRGIGMTFPALRDPVLRQGRPHPRQAGADQPAVQRHQVQPPRGAVAVECTLREPDVDPHQRARHGRRASPPTSSTQLFQPFNRLGKEASAEEGTGIGLVVTKRLVELMGGTIGVESTVGVGQRVLDRTWPDRGAAVGRAGRRRRGAAAAPASAGGAPLRTLLYVEDNPANLELVEQLIARRPDLRLLTAADGDAGHRVRARLPARGDPDGHQPAGHQRHRGDEDPARRPGHRAHPDRGAERQCRAARHRKRPEAGFFNYLTKPIKVPQFMEALDDALALQPPPGCRATAAPAATQEEPAGQP